MKHLQFGPPGVVRFAASTSPDDTSLPGFEELAIPLCDSLYNFARWLVHNQNDAEDLVQETYLKALRGFSSFQPGTNFRAWIFRILKNTVLSSRSKLESRKTVAMDPLEDFTIVPATSDTPESRLIERSGTDELQRAIEQLPEIFREVILLCDVEAASYREIAATLSIPIGTVMSRLSRARKALRESLGGAPGVTLGTTWLSRHPNRERDFETSIETQ
jgi:RNA polymerase sigma factor (sigma-70 family)